MLLLNHISYTHPGGQPLFDGIRLRIPAHEKIALTGNNGAGKSTLLRIMAGELTPAAGSVQASSEPYYIPQQHGQFHAWTIARALGVADRLQALQEILRGQMTDAHLTALQDDWSVEARSREALAWWGLGDLDLSAPMHTLSGGQKTRVFLAGIRIHEPQILLMDEPSNHLDTAGRKLLYDLVQETTATLVVVSHDRTLLRLLPSVCELSRQGLTVYGGDYDFYTGQKEIESRAQLDELQHKEQELRKARETARAAAERRQKLDARGRKKQDKAGLPTISRNTLRNQAEKSTARLKGAHAEKTDALARALKELRDELPERDRMRLGIGPSDLHTGKVLAEARDINFLYGDKPLWQQGLSFRIVSGQRIALQGRNGSGKTTLVRMLLGALIPASGTLYRAETRAMYLDQDYSLVADHLSVFAQVQQFHSGHLQEHEVKNRLNRFLFTKDSWDKTGAALSGGEKMRLSLCCLTISEHAPDLLILDEPTNNLDLRNIGILTEAIRSYTGTLIAISHDTRFLEEINTPDTLTLGEAE